VLNAKIKDGPHFLCSMPSGIFALSIGFELLYRRVKRASRAKPGSVDRDRTRSWIRPRTVQFEKREREYKSRSRRVYSIKMPTDKRRLDTCHSAGSLQITRSSDVDETARGTNT
jgi:hypothetical protein